MDDAWDELATEVQSLLASGDEWAKVLESCVITHPTMTLGLTIYARSPARKFGIELETLVDTARSHVWQGLRTFDPEHVGNLAAYLRTVAKNAVVTGAVRTVLGDHKKHHTNVEMSEEDIVDRLSRDVDEAIVTAELERFVIQVIAGFRDPVAKAVMFKLVIKDRKPSQVALEVKRTRARISQIKSEYLPKIQAALKRWHEVEE